MTVPIKPCRFCVQARPRRANDTDGECTTMGRLAEICSSFTPFDECPDCAALQTEIKELESLGRIYKKAVFRLAHTPNEAGNTIAAIEREEE